VFDDLYGEIIDAERDATVILEDGGSELIDAEARTNGKGESSEKRFQNSHEFLDLVAEFCARCLSRELVQTFFTDSKSCRECGAEELYRARLNTELFSEMLGLGTNLPELTLLYTVAGIIPLEYVGEDLLSDSAEDCVLKLNGEEVLKHISKKVLANPDTSRKMLKAASHVDSKLDTVCPERRERLLKAIVKVKVEILSELI